MNSLATVSYSSRQRKTIAKVQKVMGPDTEVLYSTLARAKFSMTPGSWILGILFVGMLVQGAVPGLILVLIFRELVTVPHYLALTANGVAVLSRAQLGGSPKKVLEFYTPGNVAVEVAKRKIVCGPQTYRPNKRDFNTFKCTIENLQGGPVEISPARTAALVGVR
jgi:hypothetical protein